MEEPCEIRLRNKDGVLLETQREELCNVKSLLMGRVFLSNGFPYRATQVKRSDNLDRRMPLFDVTIESAPL